MGWHFLVLALYLLASEFETGRRWVIALAVAGRFLRAGSRRAESIAGRRGICRDFDDLTDPLK